MSEFVDAYDAVTAQQDFAWFCAALAWAAAAVLFFQQHRTRANPDGPPAAWLAPTIAAGLLMSLGGLWLHANPPATVYDSERVGWDLAISFCGLTQTAALLAPLLSGRRTRPARLTAIGICGALLGLWLERRDYPVGANLGLAVLAAALGGGAGWRWRRTADRARRCWALGAVLAAGVPLVSTTGIWAELTAQQLRWTELSRFALPSAAWQLALAATLGAGLWPAANPLRSLIEPEKLARELRGFAWAAVAWLAAGFLLALWTGRLARRSFEESLLARARAAVPLVDAASAAACLGPTFQMVHNAPNQQPSGRTNHYVHAPSLLVAGRRTRHDLDRVELANPGIAWAHLLTLREGWLVSWAFADHLPTSKDAVSLHRPASLRDRINWAERRAFFEGPMIVDWGELVRVGAPLVSPGNRMLGWVALDVNAARWAAAQALARLQTFALVGVGLILAFFVMLQRLRTREREVAERAAQAAREADRAKTAFLAKVSHELRTPIQSILGYGELLATAPLAPEPRRWLGGLRSQSQLLIRLVNDLIDLSALQAGAFRLVPKPGDLAELVRGTTDSLRPRAAAKGLALTAEIAPGLPPWLLFDAERLRQVLLNLVGNAIKFTAQGEIRVRLAPATAGRPGFDLAVEDTGPGIAPEDQPRLFRPFSRLELTSATEGAGLGLALSAAICQSLGGSLRVESDGVRGSTFIAHLPLPACAAPPAEAPAPAASATALAGLRVLVADDNPLVRELFLSCLRGADAWCDAASDGLEAVELCAREPYAVVILDVSMPWLDGFEAARRIRAASARPPRIVGVSAHAGTGERQLALAAGMDAFLVKPVALAALLEAVAGRPTAVAGSNTSHLALLRRLRAQFHAEAPRLQAELAEALAAGDRRWLRARAHYLKNSADVAGYPEVSLLCARLDQSEEQSHSGLAATVAELSAILTHLRTVVANLSPDPVSGGSVETKNEPSP